MAKSRSKKMREKLQREGKMNPEMMRLTWGVMDGVTKKTPTLQQLKKKQKYKPGYDREDYNQANFLYLEVKRLEVYEKWRFLKRLII